MLNLAAFIAHTDFAKPNRRPSDCWNNRPELFDEVAAWVRSEAASRTCWSGVIAEKNTGTD